jgi:hypothetical protein
MSDSRDSGTILALLDRLNNHRLPRAIKLKEKVDRGNALAISDKAFLRRVMQESTNLKPLLDRNPEYREIVAKMAMLYSDITNQGLANERKH